MFVLFEILIVSRIEFQLAVAFVAALLGGILIFVIYFNVLRRYVQASVIGILLSMIIASTAFLGIMKLSQRITAWDVVGRNRDDKSLYGVCASFGLLAGAAIGKQLTYRKHSPSKSFRIY